MKLVLSEDQELIAHTALEFMAEKSPLSRFRALRDAGDELGFSRALWREMAELGWLGIPFPEAVGGADLGMAEMALVMEAAGRSLAPEPFLSCVMLAGQALLLGGSEEQKKRWLPELVAGEALLALAHEEVGTRGALHAVSTRAEPAGSGYRLEGAKAQVLDGHAADALIVSARTAGAVEDAEGISLFLVPADTPGLVRTRQQRVDSRAAALVTLDGVELPGDALLGGEGEGAVLLAAVMDRATLALCAEMLGGMSQAFEMTLAYLKEREQFGVKIGSFQALKHRAARVFMEVELCRSSVMAAARALDAEEEASLLVSLAKACCSDAYVLATNEGVQLFGGVGMTDEYDIGLFMKRARAAELTFGDSAFHRDRWAALAGY
jgi:acyl-CoA dehydrogenase